MAAGQESQFVIFGQPRTPQTKSQKSRNDWKVRCQTAALDAYPNLSPSENEFSVRMTHFHWAESIIDVDNIIKPILDACNGLFWWDDNQVTEVQARKTRILNGFIALNPSSVLARALLEELEFVWVRVSGPPNHEEVG